jgi:hypothetical protein
MVANEELPRTLLEALIRDRRQTFEEFAETVETFARENDEAGTLSVRHLQRLASGQGADGRSLGPVRPATRRLLERMLGHSAEELLGPPASKDAPAGDEELTTRLAASRSVGAETITILQQRLDGLRLLDRRLGAAHLIAELSAQIEHMQEIGRYSLDPTTRRSLAAITVDACALAGWQCLDRADPTRAWDYYTRGLTAAADSESASLRAYIMAARSVVLLDIGDYPAAVAMTEHAREYAAGRTPRILSAWLAAAHGETCAANKMRAASLRAFEDAERLLPGASAEDAPFLVFGAVHLARWRGNALARLGDAQAVDVLGDAVRVLPDGFARAETALNADLAVAHATAGEREAAELHAARASKLAAQIGSTRNRLRIDRLRRYGSLSPSTEETSADPR